MGKEREHIVFELFLNLETIILESDFVPHICVENNMSQVRFFPQSFIDEGVCLFQELILLRFSLVRFWVGVLYLAQEDCVSGLIEVNLWMCEYMGTENAETK